MPSAIMIMRVIIYRIMLKPRLVSTYCLYLQSWRLLEPYLPNQSTLDMQDLVDIDVFLDAKRVIDSLQNKEFAPALAWCAENKSRLKKSKVHITL